MKRKVPVSVAIMTVALALLLCAVVTWSAITSNERKPPHPITKAECTSCHNDAKTLKKMEEKKNG